MKWQKVRISDVCDVTGGTTPSTRVPKYWDGDITWLSPVDLPEVGTIVNVSDSQRKVTAAALADCSLRMLPIGAVVYSTRASIGKIGLVVSPLVTNQGFTNMVPGPRINNRYLAYALKRFTPQIEQLGNTTTFKEVSRTSVKNFEIPLPPLDVQLRIADTLDKADALRRKDQELLLKHDELSRSIFYEMFGRPDRNPKAWRVSQFGDLVRNIKAGTSLGGADRPLLSHEYGVLKISAVTSGVFKPEEYKVPEQSAIVKEKVTVREGDLLFSRANTRELVGAVAIAQADYPNLMLPDKLWRLDLDTDQLLNYYCKAVLSDQHIRHNLTKTATGTSGSMLNISMSKLEALEIPVPPLDLQHDFERQARQILLQKRLAQQASDQSEHLFTSLLSSYFE